MNLKTKFQFQGTIGAHIDFNYDLATGRYYVTGQPIPTFDLTREDEPQQIEVFEAIKPNSDFDWLNDKGGDIEF